MIERVDAASAGMYRVDLRRDLALARSDAPRAGEPLLLFLHGEVSDFKGTFGGLARAEREMARLDQHYAGRVFAWQYPSVSVGPVANGLALARALPEDATLHLLSWAAGGVLGELLCLAGVVQSSYPGVETVVRDPAGVEPDGGGQLETPKRVQIECRLKVHRFVRVACPAAGTAVYGRAIQRGLGVAGFLPGVGTLLSALPGADKLLTDPLASPGLAALGEGIIDDILPDGVVKQAPLTAVAGVARASGILGRFSRAAARWVTGSDSAEDLVVPLASAFGGFERVNGVDYLIDEGPPSITSTTSTTSARAVPSSMRCSRRQARRRASRTRRRSSSRAAVCRGGHERRRSAARSEFRRGPAS
jgi:hypothetical protein